jgi:retinol dehydrogenase-12
MALSFGDFMRTQLWTTIPTPTTSFASKTVIVTGASSGLGLEAVKHLVSLNAAKVILTCRDTDKGARPKQAVEASTSCDPSVLEVWKLDLDSHDSIKEFAARANRLERLDVLICNAGAQTSEFKAVNGTEVAISVNVISTFLLAFLMIPKMQETSKKYGVAPTLTFTTSALYSAAKMPEKQDDIFAWLGEEKNVVMMNQ